MDSFEKKLTCNIKESSVGIRVVAWAARREDFFNLKIFRDEHFIFAACSGQLLRDEKAFEAFVSDQVVRFLNLLA